MSHLRSSFLPISAPFNARVVDLVVCNNQRFIEKYDLTECLKQNGTIIFNTEYDINKLNEVMPDKMKAELVRKNIKAYTINAYDIALKAGLGGKINTIMQCAMFKISNLIPYDIALENIEETITKTYAKKGTKIVNANLKAIKNVEDKIVALDCSKFVLKEKLEIINLSSNDENVTPVSVTDKNIYKINAQTNELILSFSSPVVHSILRTENNIVTNNTS